MKKVNQRFSCFPLKKIKMKKGYLQISFSWIFAIIVGIFILSLAVYGVVKLMKSEQITQDAKTGKELGTLLNPLETGFESGSVVSITMPVETRIYNKCRNSGNFGTQLIQISQKSFGKWTETDIDVGFENKYIFSNVSEQGKKFYFFSKPFEFGFKVSDLIYMTSSENSYCFVDAPEEIADELSALGQKNIFVDNCSNDATRVCFENAGCDIEVNYDAEYVKKKDGTVYFKGDALMYAGIFANKENYECQLKRLMQRVSSLALLYKDKAVFIKRVSCDSELNLAGLSVAALGLESSAGLNSVSLIAEDVGNKNEYAECKLW